MFKNVLLVSFCLVSFAACKPRTNNDSIAQSSSNIGAQSKAIQSKYAKNLAEDDVVAMCFDFVGDDPQVSLRLKGKVSSTGTVTDLFNSPSIHHEPNFSGQVAMFTSPPQTDEGVVSVEMRNGTLKPVVGEEGQGSAVQTVSKVVLKSILDDAAAREYRNVVVLTTSAGEKKFSRCGFGKMIANFYASTPASGTQDFLVANCKFPANSGPDIAGHTSLYMVAVVDNKTKKVTRIKTMPGDFNAMLSGTFNSAKRIGQTNMAQGTVEVSIKGFIETRRGHNSIENMTLDEGGGSVHVVYMYSGETDVHSDSVRIENCEIKNTKLLVNGGL